MISASKIKEVRRFHQKKFRDEAGCFLVEGEKLVSELLNSDFRVREIFATEAWQATMEFTKVSPSELERLSTQKNPQNVLAIVEQKPASEPRPDVTTLVLDEINDPGNLGTILRSAAWFGIEQVVCSRQSVEVYNPKTVRASMGAIFKVNVVVADLETWLPTVNLPKYGFALGGDNLYTTTLASPSMLVLGSESHGMRQEVVNLLDHQIEIPGANKMESLNVAMATTLVLGEAFRQASS